MKRIFLLGIILSFCQSAQASHIVFYNHQPDSTPNNQLQTACDFYGITLISTDEIKRINGDKYALDGNDRVTIMGLVLTAKSLEFLNERDQLQEILNTKIPIFITAISEKSSLTPINRLTGNLLSRIDLIKNISPESYFHVNNIPGITKELSGQALPFSLKQQPALNISSTRNTKTILELSHPNKEKQYPIFLHTLHNDQEIFLLARQDITSSSLLPSHQFNKKNFWQIAPFLLFLKHVAEKYIWQNPKHFANLTIDDPWLIEPYGHLSYSRLIKEMEEVPFHTTIAFVPWNFDRSQKNVVKLFKQHPDKLSICIHGNNHDHREFSFSKSTELQETNIRQAIARMEQFHRLTSLQYDKVMVFPHGIAPLETLNLLKKYNFLATANSSNIPLGQISTQNQITDPMVVTLQYANFPSLRRYHAKEITPLDVAIELFLDNPILLYGHHDLFQTGIDSFNNIAAMINDIDPKIRWNSLANITKNLYQYRHRPNGNLEVRMFSSSIDLMNDTGSPVMYHLEKEESNIPPIKNVTIDRQTIEFTLEGTTLKTTTIIPQNHPTSIKINYSNDFDPSSIASYKQGFRITALRHLSDFRDLHLSTTQLGQFLVETFYNTGLYKLGLALFFIFLTICFFISTSIYILYSRAVRNKSQPSEYH